MEREEKREENGEGEEGRGKWRGRRGEREWRGRGEENGEGGEGRGEWRGEWRGRRGERRMERRMEREERGEENGEGGEGRGESVMCMCVWVCLVMRVHIYDIMCADQENVLWSNYIQEMAMWIL